MNILDDSLFDVIFQIKTLRIRRLTLHKEAVKAYGPLYFIHPDYLESDLGLWLNTTCNLLESKVKEVKSLTNEN